VSQPFTSQESAGLLSLLQLLQLADSAVPIGATAHSFGLETLIEDGYLQPETLYPFLLAQLEEALRVDAHFCAEAHRLALCADDVLGRWQHLNRELTAWKPAEESRNASLLLGRRFLRLVESVATAELIGQTQAASGDVHLAAAFGWCTARIGVGREVAVGAYLHQAVTGMVFAAQRLMPVGQAQAARILWMLKAPIASVAASDPIPLQSFSILPEIASMRHASQYSRLFIS
jgi:urease accessory protein